MSPISCFVYPTAATFNKINNFNFEILVIIFVLISEEKTCLAIMSNFLVSHYGSGQSMCLSSRQSLHSEPYIDPVPISQHNMENTIDVVSNLEFRCILAEGSRICYVSNFSSMVELYEKIAKCFDISPKEVKYKVHLKIGHDLNGVLALQYQLTTKRQLQVRPNSHMAANRSSSKLACKWLCT